MNLGSVRSSHQEDDQSDRGLAGLLALPVEKAVEFQEWHPGRESVPAETRAQSKPKNSMLSEAELSYLRVVVDHPGKPSSAYPAMAGIGARRGQVIRKRLVELGYLREHSVNTGKRGRASIILEPLEPALEVLVRQAQSREVKSS